MLLTCSLRPGQAGLCSTYGAFRHDSRCGPRPDRGALWGIRPNYVNAQRHLVVIIGITCGVSRSIMFRDTKVVFRLNHYGLTIRVII